MDTYTHEEARRQKAGGVAALYLALTYLAAMPYFLLVVDYQSATTVAEKVALIVGSYPSMYAMYIATYVLGGIALGVGPEPPAEAAYRLSDPNALTELLGALADALTTVRAIA